MGRGEQSQRETEGRRRSSGKKLPPPHRWPASMAAVCAPTLCKARVLGSRQRALKPCKPFTTLAPTILTRNIIRPHS